MTFAGAQLAEITETRAYRDIVAIRHEEGLQPGRQEGLREGKRDEAVALVLRQLTTEELEPLAEALLDFQSVADLEAWLAERQLG